MIYIIYYKYKNDQFTKVFFYMNFTKFIIIYIYFSNFKLIMNKKIFII